MFLIANMPMRESEKMTAHVGEENVASSTFFYNFAHIK